MKNYLIYRFLIYLKIIIFIVSSSGFFAYAQPANNNCANAIALTVGAACVNGTTALATIEGGESTANCGSTINQSVWYKFVATSTNHVVTAENLLTGGCHFNTAVYSGACLPTTILTCENAAIGPVIQVHSLSGLTVGNTYLIRIGYGTGGPCGSSQTFCIKVETGSFTNNGGCACATNFAKFNMGSCHSGSLNGATACLNSGCKGVNPDAHFLVVPNTTTMFVTVDNLGSGFTGNVEINIWSGNDCGALVFVTSSCGPITCPSDVFSFSQAVTAGTQYWIGVSSSDGANGANSDFGICIGNGVACAVTGCGVAPGTAGNNYGIYAADGAAAVTDCEIINGAAICGAIACKVCTPTDDAYANVQVTGYPVITAENISCLNTNMDFTTTDPSPSWTGFGVNATTVTPTAANPVLDNQYTATLGRRTIGFNGDLTQTYSSYTFSASPALAIPDGANMGGCTVSASNTIAVACPSAVSTADISVTVNITHTCVADLEIYLLAPNGSILDLSTDNNGTCGDNYTNTVFTDGAAASITTGTPPFTGSFKPEGSAGGCTSTNVATFGAIGGGTINPAGNWILRVWDDYLADVGTIDSWSITFKNLTCVTPNVDVNYTGFVNMQQPSPSTGSVLGATPVCPNTVNNYASSVAGTPGFTYAWSASTACGTCTYTNSTPTASSTDMSFTNTTGVVQTFTVSLTITSQCCGTLTPITKLVTVNPQPANPAATATPASICTGGSSTLSVTGPIAGYNYGWYTVPTGGTSFATGTTTTINPVLAGLTTYYIDAVSANGCPAAARGSVTVTGTNTPPVVPDPASDCAPGVITATVSSPISGATYNWYSDPGLTILLQSDLSTSYGINVPGPGPNSVTVYVTVIEPGCAESTSDLTTASITASPASVTWNGSGSANWFTAANWTPACVPTCQVDVVLPSGALPNQPSIDFDLGGIACVKGLSIDAARTLTLVGNKSVLEINGNWTNNGTFTAGTGLVKFTGSAAQSIGGTAVATFYNLAIDKSASAVTMLLNANVSNQLNLTNGVLGLNSNTLTITNGVASAILRANGYVLSENEISYIAWNSTAAGAGTFVFPFGYSGNYIPFIFTKDAGDAACNLTVSTWNTNDANCAPAPSAPAVCPVAPKGKDFFVDRWWSVTPVPVLTAAVTFTYTAAELSTVLDPALPFPVTYHWNSGIANWDEITATVSGNSVTSTWSSFSGGGGGGAGGGVPLPIRLLNFDAKPNLNVVDLTWVTASETNNDYFTIEKTTNASDFDIVVKVPGAGTSTQILYYKEYDKDPYYGTSYYRLKQTDYDGKYEYSDLVAVKFLKKLNFSVRPNPATDYLEITFGEISKNVIFVMTPEYDASIKIYDALGEIVYEKKFNGTFYKFNIDISSFSQGMYFVSLTANNELYKAKFVKE